VSGPVVGIDVGGQSAKGVLMSPAGDILAQGVSKTDERMTPDAFAAAMVSLRDALAGQARLDRAPETIGLGIAGVLDRSGALRGSPHLPLLVGSRIGSLLGAAFGAPVPVHNDADCAAMGEGWGGAAAGCDDFLLVAIGTGVGSGLVLGGRLRAGASGYGCEFGHMTIVHGGRRCGCGNLGCLEAYISETAAGKLVAEASDALRARVAARRDSRGGGAAQAISELGAGGDEEAERIAGFMVEHLGAAIGSAVNVLDLTTIVLGGGIAPAVVSRLPELREAAKRTLFARPVDDLEIVAAKRGSLAGAIGAARLGMLAAAQAN
jgi:glucokinase